MKKIISVFLAIIMMMSFSSVILTANAAVTYDITVTLPTGKTYGSDLILIDTNGDPINGVVRQDGSYLIANIPANTSFLFNIEVAEQYDVRYTKPYVNGEVPQYFDELGAYAIYMDSDFALTFPENNGENFRIRMLYVSNPYDEGFVVRPEIIGEGYKENYLVEWGKDYTFRVILNEGFRGAFNFEEPIKSRMSVYVVSYSGIIYEADYSGNGTGNLKYLKDKTEKAAKKVYSENGKYTDDKGNKYDLEATEIYFQLTDIKDDMHIKVSGVMADQTVSIFSWLFKILSLLMALFTGEGLGDIGLGDIFGGIDFSAFSQL